MTFLNRHRFLLLRIALSAVLITFILTRTELDRVISILMSARPDLLALALFVLFLERVLLAYKWSLLLAAKGMDVSLMRLIKICYVTNFVGSFLPSSLGVDALRSYSLYRHGTNLAESVSSVVADKVLSLFIVLALPVTVLLLFPAVFPSNAVRWTVLGIAGVLTIAVVCSLNRRIVGIGMSVVEKVSRRVAVKVLMLHDSVCDYLGYRKVVRYVLLLSLGFQILRILGVYLIGRSMLPGFSLLHCLAFVPVIVILTMIPVSVGGIGVREGGFVYFFSQVGIAVSDAFALAVLVYAVGIISVLPGGAIYAMEGMASSRRHDQKPDTTFGKL